MTDPVASRSGFLCTYMSNHPDTLVAYVRHFGKVKVTVVSASMTSIDTKGMLLSYVEKGTDAKQHVAVLFDPPLSGYEEVKPRLLEMKLDAEEALRMTKRPQITTFEFPSLTLVTAVLLVLLIYVTYSAPGTSSPLFDIGARIHSATGGLPKLKIIWAIVVAIHTLETAFMLRLCMRHSLGPGVAAKYLIATFIFGFPVIQRLRKLIQKARIDSITKIH